MSCEPCLLVTSQAGQVPGEGNSGRTKLVPREGGLKCEGHSRLVAPEIGSRFVTAYRWNVNVEMLHEMSWIVRGNDISPDITVFFYHKLVTLKLNRMCQLYLQVYL